jgi:hypothetical protein
MPDERVVWTGRPVAGLFLTANDWLLIPFSLLWSVIALYALGSIFLSGLSPVSVVLATMFGLTALFFLGGRFVIDAWIRSRTLYAVTTRRALEIRAVFTQKLLTAPLAGGVDLRPGRGGRGTLSFGMASDVGAFNAAFGRRGNWQFWLPGVTNHVCFLAVADPGEAHRFASATPAP